MIERLQHAEVEGIRVGRFAQRYNTTCILYRLGSTVIDTGPPNQWRLVEAFLAERAVRQVVVTHYHEDHGGNLAPIRRAFGAPLYAPRQGLAELGSGFPLRLYQRLFWGRPEPVRAQELPPRLALDGGGALEAIPAAGHSADMTCLLARERGWLFAGDLYIAAKVRLLRQDEDLQAEIASLRRVLACDFDTLFCAHRGVLSDGKAALRRKLDFISSLCQQVADLDRQGRGLPEITRLLLGREGLMTLVTGWHFSKRNLIAACLRALPPGGGAPPAGAA
ncbi:MAG: MBL fold metallo-hydrolase [Acidobacteria bacterium]|nr:MBL fold metallo-hydrolase [Acidobacteriota bacterium]